MELLLSSLCLAVPAVCPTMAVGNKHSGDVFDVPYDKNGMLSSSGPRQVWDLSEGKELIVAIGPNKGDKAFILGKNADGHYRVAICRSDVECNGQWNEVRLMGKWWIDSAVAGTVQCLPLVNGDER